jgi:2-amino-4-hydroxy-6-hydroxymethyldihydropteridine diphosphokinase
VKTPVLIALGSNQGNSPANVRKAMDRLGHLADGPILRSSLWQTTPVDCPPGSPCFINAAVVLHPLPDETPEGLLEKLLSMEGDFGRLPRKVRNEPRPIDLDLIAFGSELRQSEALMLPHPRAHERRFVLQPLAEIAPDFVLPGQSRTIVELLEQLPPGEIVNPFA